MVIDIDLRRRADIDFKLLVFGNRGRQPLVQGVNSFDNNRGFLVDLQFIAGNALAETEIKMRISTSSP